MTEQEALLSLNMVPQLGSRSLKKLWDFFGSAKEVFNATNEDLKRIGFSASQIDAITKNKNKIDLKKEMDLIKKHKVKIITIEDSDYPKNLKTIFDPPFVLYIKGELCKEDNLAIAIVGSRRASFYGLSMAEKLSYELGELGFTIVSGMARGIDSASHRGALKSNARTIAVLGSGLAKIYPPENKDLFEKISSSGAVISEFPMEEPPLAMNFPRRNRIISGLCLGVVVVEASQKSGALITSSCALEQGREVFAIPGKADSKNSWGANQLIKDGAKLTVSIEDIIEEFKPYLKDYFKQKPKTEINKESINKEGLSKDEVRILETIGKDAKYVDDLSQEIDLSLGKVMSILTNLEMRHLVKQLPGKLFVREC